MSSINGTDVGLLIARVGLAVLLAGHATQKLFGWFRGMGVTATGEMFDRLGFRPGKLMVVVAGAGELVGASLVGFGLLTSLGVAVILGTMIVAAATLAGKGLWAHLGGCEVPVVYALLAVVIGVAGPGRLSLDNALGWLAFDRWPVTGLAIAIGCLAAIPPLVRRRRFLQLATATSPPGQ